MILKNKFVQAQKIFDKSLRSAERNYNRDTLQNIEKLNVNDPNAFWAHIKRMGSRSRNIPLNFDKDGMTTTDITTVLENWKTEFESLYNQTGQGDWDDQFYENAKQICITTLKVWSTVKIRGTRVPQKAIVPVGRPSPYSIIILNMRFIPKTSLRASS